MIIELILGLVLPAYIGYRFMKALWSDNDRPSCSHNCNCKNCQNTKQAPQQPTYTYTATPNKTTSATQL